MRASRKFCVGESPKWTVRPAAAPQLEVNKKHVFFGMGTIVFFRVHIQNLQSRLLRLIFFHGRSMTYFNVYLCGQGLLTLCELSLRIA